MVSENCGWARLFVSRRGKIRKGRCVLQYETQDITAQGNFDYVPAQNEKLTFDGQEYEKYIDIEIIDDKQDEKDETFYVELLSTSDSSERKIILFEQRLSQMFPWVVGGNRQ